MSPFAIRVVFAMSVPHPVTPILPLTEREQLEWAQYSPYFARAVYKEPPSGCQIDQVNILQRHGARFPTSGAATKIQAALAKLQTVTNFTDSRLDFVKSFTFNLGTDDLVKFGADQSFDAGQEAFLRYSKLFDGNDIPFVRSDVSARVVASANNWTAGFAFASQNVFQPHLAVILGIGASTNDTLDDSQCPDAGDSTEQVSAWEAVYATPIANRLNTAAPGANLTTTDVFNLISLCPFDTIFNFKKSPWCTLFEQFPTALPGFAYDGDLNKFYGTGYGQPLGPVQGVGYINELLSRLTHSPVRDSTQTNRTLDSSPLTFPLTRSLYADFTHDDEIAAIVSAIGLFRQPRPLDPTNPGPDSSRTWKASTIVPFSGRVVVERLVCTVTARTGPGVLGLRKKSVEGKVRVLVQDEVQHLEFCEADEDGVCTLDAFVESQSFAREDGDGEFQECFAGVSA
ncbi:phytase [Cytidiella melzeri]|nr:phytase [Cytidiella melzeri]